MSQYFNITYGPNYLFSNLCFKHGFLTNSMRWNDLGVLSVNFFLLMWVMFTTPNSSLTQQETHHDNHNQTLTVQAAYPLRWQESVCGTGVGICRFLVWHFCMNYIVSTCLVIPTAFCIVKAETSRLTSIGLPAWPGYVLGKYTFIASYSSDEFKANFLMFDLPTECSHKSPEHYELVQMHCK